MAGDKYLTMAMEQKGDLRLSAETEATISVGPDTLALWDKIIEDAAPSPATVAWITILSGLFSTYPPARAFAALVPQLAFLADPDDMSSASMRMGSDDRELQVGSILGSQIKEARNLASKRSNTDLVYSQDLLFLGLLRCAKLAAEMGQTAPRYRNNLITQENLTLLAFELAIMALSPNDNASALAGYDDTKFDLQRLLPTREDPGTSRADIRRRMREAGIDIVAIEPASLDVALVIKDDPWAPGLKDRSGSELEVAAFASMFTARAFQPPLAVGVFGDWGSGKSFFMRRLSDKVEDFVAAESDDPEALQRVVQIHFNAWHYAETNLWASIVDRIFTELDTWTQTANADAERVQMSVVEQLDTARKLTIESIAPLAAARRKQADAKTQLEDAAKLLADMRARVEVQKSTQLQAAFNAVLQNEDLKKKVGDAGKTLGIQRLNASLEDFRTATQALSEQEASARQTVGTLLGRIGIGWGLFLCTLVVLAPIAIATLLPALLLQLFPALAAQIGTAISLVAGSSGLLAVAAATLRNASRHSTRALDSIRTFERSLNAEIAKRSADQTSEYVRAQGKVAAAQAEVNKRRDALEDATQQADRASAAFSANEPRQRLVDFLRDRVSSGTYARELSVIAAVRKDFEMLSRLMATSASPSDTPEALRNSENRLAIKAEVKRIMQEAGDALEPDEKVALKRLAEPPPPPPVTFERIILYIDDLDRCPPKQVVAVLQAIHLLLAFPLFVVVVAVDSRWVLKSLGDHYGDLLSGDENSASSVDYLEKIIQIPYQVRHVRSVIGNSMIGDLLAPFVASDVGDEAAPIVDQTPAAPGTDIKGGQTDHVDALPVKAPDTPEPALRKHLAVEAHELELLDRIDGALNWSPRRRLRFANSYLLSRASLSDISDNDVSNLAVVLACSEAEDRDAAIKDLCDKVEVLVPTPQTLEKICPICDRFSFRSATEGGIARN